MNYKITNRMNSVKFMSFSTFSIIFLQSIVHIQHVPVTVIAPKERAFAKRAGKDSTVP